MKNDKFIEAYKKVIDESFTHAQPTKLEENEMSDKERIIDDYCDRTLGEFCFNLSPEEAIRLRDLLKNEESEELKALFIMVDDAVNRK